MYLPQNTYFTTTSLNREMFTEPREQMKKGTKQFHKAMPDFRGNVDLLAVAGDYVAFQVVIPLMAMDN